MKTGNRRMKAFGYLTGETGLMKGLALWTVFFLTVLIFPLRTPGAAETASASAKYKTLSDFSGMTLGSQTGTMFDRTIGKAVPDIKSRYYDDIGGLILALRSGNVDAIGLDQPVAALVAAQNKDFAIFPEMISNDQYGLALSKNSALTREVSAVIERYAADGTLDQLKKKWFSGDPEQMKIDYREYADLPAPNGVLKYSHDSTLTPMSYVDDSGASAGYEVELVLMIGKELGKKVELTKANFSALLASVSSGKADIVSGAITITDERREQVDFATSHYTGGVVLLCRRSDLTDTDPTQDGDPAITKGNDPSYQGGEAAAVRKTGGDGSAKKSFLTSLRESFEKTFVREQRWKLVLSGLWITVILSLLSALLGTVLGFGLCLLRRRKNRVLSGICAVFIRLIQGIPMLVLLMVLYYIVFASANMNGIAVAVIAFAVNFGVYVSEMMRTGIDAVDRGQWEAAETLGFGRTGTFTKIIAPQALRHILPVYKGELISMVKMTSVVGYIAIQDLTKASDIIRSRTYDAFFPLIATALIYFVLAWGMTLLLGRAEVRIDPQKRRPGLKGVNTSGTPDAGIADAGKTAGHSREQTGEMIRIEHLKKVYPHVTPLQDVNAQIMRGDVVTIIGPSGTGKSTLLRNINHLETPTSGSISVFGNRLPDSGPELQKVRQRMGMVFQNFNLFPHLTVIENIMLAPVELKKIPRQEAYDTAMRILTTVGLSLKAFSYPDELSGGQKQRVAIARALAMDPEIILFDEPTSALDPTMVGEVLAVIRSLAKQGLTMMIVTHEMKFARDVSTRIFYMDEGTVYEEGTPEQIFNHPQKEKTRQFVNRLKVYRYEIRSKEFDFIELSTQLENFGQKHFIPAKLVNRLQTVIEELCVQTILPRLAENPQMDITVEYSDDPAHIETEIVYNGGNADLLQQADKLSAALIRNACAEIRYTYEDENLYRIAIR